ncbi:MAG: DUF4331 family protein [Deltaproteobacteria bacterium]|nr:DUF4331 family protein [Deltaproteobacteria bacterium]
MQRRTKLATKLGTALLVASTLPLGGRVDAADHRDAPGTQAEPVADINDVYAWYKADTDTIVVIITFNPLLAPDAGEEQTYNVDELPNVLYTIHIDNDSAPVANPTGWDSQDGTTFGSDIAINVRFGTNSLNEWGVQFENVPGSSGTIVGPVEMALHDRDVTVQAGIFDDPFFFDLTGFIATIANLDDPEQDPIDLAFRSLTGVTENDDLAGLNTMAIVVEMPAAEALADNPDGFLQIWATTGRAPK